MKHPEEAIDKLLAGVRDIEAPPGMERRILETLERRSSAHSRLHWLRSRPLWLIAPAYPIATRVLAGSIAAGIVLAIAAITSATHHTGSTPDTFSTQRKPAPASTGILAAKTPESAAAGTQPSLITSSARAQGANKLQRVVLVRDPMSVAPHDQSAVSYPAPPLPLTEQEKLLRRIAHKARPVDLAILNPEIRVRQETEARAEFQRFFEPSPTPANQ